MFSEVGTGEKEDVGTFESEEGFHEGRGSG